MSLLASWRMSNVSVSALATSSKSDLVSSPTSRSTLALLALKPRRRRYPLYARYTLQKTLWNIGAVLLVASRIFAWLRDIVTCLSSADLVGRMVWQELCNREAAFSISHWCRITEPRSERIWYVDFTLNGRLQFVTGNDVVSRRCGRGSIDSKCVWDWTWQKTSVREHAT